jgi:NitT/TauT family transport system permease protein
MLSVAGGWFFLTVCESYTLGNTSYRLVGIGSYMALAAEKGDTIAMIAGVSLMLLLLVASDYFIWKPLLRWSRRFQKSVLASEEDEEDRVILFFTRSERISSFIRKLRRKYADRLFVTRRKKRKARVRSKWLTRLPYFLFAILVVFCVWGSYEAVHLTLTVPSQSWLVLGEDTLFTFSRVMAVLILSSCTMVPLGLWLGTHPSLVSRLQPILQIAAAFPMPMVFPVFISFFVFLNIPISIGSILLMMTGAQWFLLFNVISGVAGVPDPMVEVAKLSGMKSLQIMRRVYLPAAFPQIVTGLISTVGGAWNTSIVAELVVFRGKEYIAPGLGTFIAKAASEARYPELVAGVIIMVLVIVLINRTFWAKLYDLAQTRYRLDA